MDTEELDDIELEDASVGEKESPFRRRPRAVPVRRGRLPRLRKVLRWALWLGLFLTPMSYGGYRLAVFGFTSPEFTLTSSEHVDLAGNRYVSREEAINALGLPPEGKLSSGINILKMSMDEKRRQLESIPWVERATLTRAYPNRLAVHLEERDPIAFVQLGGRIKLVDRHGVVLEKPERASFSFPVVTGLDKASGPAERAARLALFSGFTRDVAEQASAAGWIISEVDLSDADDLKAMLARNREALQLHFGHASFAERFRNFLTLLPELKKAGRAVDSIDLRYGRQVVVSPRADAPVPPEETPAAAPPGTREN